MAKTSIKAKGRAAAKSKTTGRSAAAGPKTPATKATARGTAKVTSKTTKKTASKVTTNEAKPARGAKKASAASVAYRLAAGDNAPAFQAQATSGKTVRSSELSGRHYVLYFYPKDNTPGCTLEGRDFARIYDKFKAAACEVFGVSRDSAKSHEGFKAKCGFPFELIADEDGALCRAYDVIQMKSLYGRKFEGIERSTFVIDQAGQVRGEWRKVRVNGHAAEVLAFVENLG